MKRMMLLLKTCDYLAGAALLSSIRMTFSLPSLSSTNAITLRSRAMPARPATCAFVTFCFSPRLSRMVLCVQGRTLQLELAVLVREHRQVVLNGRAGRVGRAALDFVATSAASQRRHECCEGADAQQAR
jgi:hypothetical protein